MDIDISDFVLIVDVDAISVRTSAFASIVWLGSNPPANVEAQPLMFPSAAVAPSQRVSVTATCDTEQTQHPRSQSGQTNQCRSPEGHGVHVRATWRLPEYFRWASNQLSPYNEPVGTGEFWPTFHDVLRVQTRAETVNWSVM
jgi:hypothetical protein